MEAIILAGGFGTRMRPLTYTRPKPLLPILNRPLVQSIIDRLPKEVDTILLPVNYLREQIEAYFEEHADERVVLVEEAHPLGTGGAIKNCADHLTAPFLVYNGDIVASIDLDRMRRTHASTGAKITVSLWPVEEPWHFGVVRLEPDGRIGRFVEKPPQGAEPSNLINAGHYLLDLEVLDELKAGQPASMERAVFERWAERGNPIFGFRFDGYWVDCGRPEALLQAHAALLRESRQTKVVAKSARIAAGARVDGYAVGDECTIGRGSVVERSVLMRGVRLGPDVVLRDTILGEGVEIESGARLESSVVGDFGVVAAASQIRNGRVGLRAGDVRST